MSKNKVKVWLARDKSGALWLYQSIPNRYADEWFCDEPICEIDSSKLPSIKWEDDEPTEAYITLAKPQEEEEIDWEQRRYEIAKELLYSFATKISIIDFTRQEEQYADLAIYVADALIKKLKTYTK